MIAHALTLAALLLPPANAPMIRTCARNGFDAVEYDNLDVLRDLNVTAPGSKPYEYDRC